MSEKKNVFRVGSKELLKFIEMNKYGKSKYKGRDLILHKETSEKKRKCITCEAVIKSGDTYWTGQDNTPVFCETCKKARDFVMKK